MVQRAQTLWRIYYDILDHPGAGAAEICGRLGLTASEAASALAFLCEGRWIDADDGTAVYRATRREN
ncbi:hypothetical protein dsx2_2699 [Desulfovibrio sp. X2]|uniref:winged helix DNA-binding protein n=1 Tax=Desulfovibrio sp. X2 TaxID=941449 RepID=UPI00035892FD|nr:winged helix DNA-binding protein [Desulfovibrio sp. X2]EPR42782.1 hypothetical protein dsx2_2699 [Desulfovibrio sp. X2]